MTDIATKATLALKPFLDMSGYEPKTTFWMDFSVAEPFGKDAIIDTYNRAFNEWKSNRVYITELVLILNWKIWQHQDDNLGPVYNELWGKADEWCMENMKGDDLAYFLETTD